MATGWGDGFGLGDPDLDSNIDNEPYDDNDDEQEVDTTRPFQPVAASTPYHGGEEIQMQTMQHDQSGLPDTSNEETPLLTPSADADLERRLRALRENTMTGIIDTTKMMDTSINPLSEEERAKQIQKVKNLIKAVYPNAKLDGLVISFSRKRPMDIVVKGPRGGETKIVLDDGSALQKSFLNLTYVKKALGPPSEQIIKQQSDHIRKRQEELKKEREIEDKDFQISQQNLRSKDGEIYNLDERLKKEQAMIDQLKENQGPDEEIKRKDQLIKNLKKDLKTKQKERKELEKKSKRCRNKTREFRPT